MQPLEFQKHPRLTFTLHHASLVVLRVDVVCVEKGAALVSKHAGCCGGWTRGNPLSRSQHPPCVSQRGWFSFSVSLLSRGVEAAIGSAAAAIRGPRTVGRTSDGAFSVPLSGVLAGCVPRRRRTPTTHAAAAVHFISAKCDDGRTAAGMRFVAISIGDCSGGVCVLSRRVSACRCYCLTADCEQRAMRPRHGRSLPACICTHAVRRQERVKGCVRAPPFFDDDLGCLLCCLCALNIISDVFDCCGDRRRTDSLSEDYCCGRKWFCWASFYFAVSSDGCI